MANEPDNNTGPVPVEQFDDAATEIGSDVDSLYNSKIDRDIEIQGDVAPEPVHRLFTWLLWNKKVAPIPLQSDRKALPLYTASFISRGFFLWLIPLLKKGYKRTILQEDLWFLGDDNRVDILYPTFRRHLQDQIDKHHKKHPDSEEWPQNAIMWAIIQTFKYQYVLSIVLKWASCAMESFAPLVTKHLIQFFSHRAYSTTPPDMSYGIGLCFGLTIMVMATVILQNHAFMQCAIIGSHSRTLLTKAMLERVLDGSSETRQKFPSGVVIGYMAADLERIDEGITNSFAIFGAPVSVVIGLVLLLINLKVSALAGLGVFFLLTVITGLPGILMFKLRIKINVHSDKRVALMRQIIQAMKFIKLYAWEDAYEKIMYKIRSKEIGLIYQMHGILALMFSLAFTISSFTSMSAFLVSYALDGLGQAAIIFSSLTLFSVLCLQITTAAFTIPLLIDAFTAVKRIGTFLQAPVDTRTFDDIYDRDLITDPNVAVQMKDADFKWNVYEEEKKNEEEDNDTEAAQNLTEREDEKHNKKQKKKDKKKEGDDGHAPPTFIHKEKNILNGISLEIMKGEFIIVTGSTGSGKSSMLAAINGMMEQTRGSMGVNGSMILCGTSWVQNTTIKENILFGEQFDSIHYKEVLHACALDGDLDSFKAADMTQVGDRGVTLSGGQKARVNLARAVYRGAEIYLLDDIISAVDAKVGKEIIQRCIFGEIAYSTRILATNNLDLLKRADRIIFLNGDGSIDFGTEEELRSRNAAFRNLLEYQKGGQGILHDMSREMIEELTEPARTITKSYNDEEGLIVSDEERAVNSIPLKTYLQLAGAAKGPLLVLALASVTITAILGHFCMVFANVWLSYWLEQKFEYLRPGEYMGFYVMITFFSFLLPSVELALIGFLLAKAAKTLHMEAIHRILHTPMAYIDVTPVGRIMNRFSQDTNMLDNEIGMQLKKIIIQVGLMVATIILSVIYVPWFALMVPMMLFVFLVLTNFTQATGREVKRLEAINRSFIFSNFNEVVDGLDTIRSFGRKLHYNSKNDKMVDNLNEVRLVFLANQKFLANFLSVLASLSVLVITLLAVTNVFPLGPATVGLLVTYSVQFGDISMDILSTWAELENQMNSLERVCHYAYDLEQEKDHLVYGIIPPPEWPQAGVIEMSRVEMRYRPELPVTLKSLSLRINSFEKIGICGRTGAGKSSVMNALFRLNNLDSGSIIIDGYDISKVGLQQLRSKLSIIPQDPVLFQGTIRSNLDPFGERSEEELWDVLKRGGLIQDVDAVKAGGVSSHKFHLDAAVSGEASNFSLGESQLIAMARALVRGSKILVMDEATSSVDFETDALIQATIAREFKDCTILCIAHRLKTILNYDRILVLEKGSLEEFDTPQRLFNKQGRFREMCDNAGITSTDF